jgi:hypothetical protein
MLLIFRPFRIGHKVQIGGSSIGVVKELSLFWTELVTDDKVQVIVPNSGVWGQPLRNFSIYPAAPHAGEIRFQLAGDTELDPASIRCALSSRPIRACSRTRSRACCWTAAQQETRSRSSLVSLLTMISRGR